MILDCDSLTEIEAAAYQTWTTPSPLYRRLGISKPALRAQVGGFQPDHDKVRHFALSPISCRLRVTECLPAAPILAKPVATGEEVSGWEAAGGSPPSSTSAATTQGVTRLTPPSRAILPPRLIDSSSCRQICFRPRHRTPFLMPDNGALAGPDVVGGSPDTLSLSRGDPTDGATAESGLPPLICNFLPVSRFCVSDDLHVLPSILERNNNISGPFLQVPSQQKLWPAIKSDPPRVA